MKSVTSHSVEETEAIARDWLEEIASIASTSQSGTVVGLSGELGAGKTAFVKATAKNLGITEEITSPTFVIMKFYNLTTGKWPWKKLVHIDAYRLEKAEELAVLGFEELIRDANNLVMVEWPSHVEEVIKDVELYKQVSLKIPIGDHTTKNREITFN